MELEVPSAIGLTTELTVTLTQKTTVLHLFLLFCCSQKKVHAGHYWGFEYGTSILVLMNGTVKGTRGRGRQKMRWEDNNKEWTGMDFASSARATKNRTRWQGIVAKLSWWHDDLRILKDRNRIEFFSAYRLNAY